MAGKKNEKISLGHCPDCGEKIMGYPDDVPSCECGWVHPVWGKVENQA